MAAVSLLKTTVSKSNSNASTISAGSASLHNQQSVASAASGGGHGTTSAGGNGGSAINKMSAALSVQQHNQLTRTLERILEDAHLSGELKLSGRKLRDFPKAAGKYNLNDTVIADLSRNRFSELPDELTAFPFLETLFMCHNTLRSLPESVRGLHSLTYLDLRSNQLSVLPRELCFLPLQVLLVSNNRLVALPEELGRMDRLTELDAASNQMSHLPARMSDLHALRSLSLRSNSLVYLPREVTYLSLVSLDISNNRIASLPVELRIMTTLVALDLENNPLTSPPASVCVRGLVHVFKYLETVAAKEERIKSGAALDGHGTLRRTSLAKQQHHQQQQLLYQQQLQLQQQLQQQHDHNKYNTLGGVRRLVPPVASVDPNPHQQQQPAAATDNVSKWSPTHQQLLPLHNNNGNGSSGESPAMSPQTQQRHQLLGDAAADSDSGGSPLRAKYNATLLTGDESSPDGEAGTPDSQRSDEKLKLAFNSTQSYREYKEALRQQRNQDSTAVYRPKDDQQHVHFAGDSNGAAAYSRPPPVPGSGGGVHSPGDPAGKAHAFANGFSPKHQPANGDTIDSKTPPLKSPLTPSKTLLPQPAGKTYHTNGGTMTANGNAAASRPPEKIAYGHYVKPSSPSKGSSAAANTLGYNNVPAAAQQNGNGKSATASSPTASKPTRTVSWNRDIPNDKLSFTMRREFDKQKEETELIEQLRQIIESRLKMTLPEDVASALTDGVVLCHLANQVRARSVGSIHVPSAAVPKLTMARCRRNVDNFLNACRHIGVDEEWLCSCADILPTAADDQHHGGDPPAAGERRLTPSALVAVHRSVVGLHTWALAIEGGQPRMPTVPMLLATDEASDDSDQPQRRIQGSCPPTSTTTATMTSTDADEYRTDEPCNARKRPTSLEITAASHNNNNCDHSNNNNNEPSVVPNNDNHAAAAAAALAASAAAATLRSKKRRAAAQAQARRANGVAGGQQMLGGIVEECEYDSDAGKFTCAIGPADSASSSSLASSAASSLTSASLADEPTMNADVSSTPSSTVSTSVAAMAAEELVPTVVSNVSAGSFEHYLFRPNTADERRRSTLLFLGSFVLTALLLYLFPLPE